MANFLNLSKSDSSILNGLHSNVMSKQAQIAAFGKMADTHERMTNILKAPVTWINTANKPLYDEKTGKTIKPRSIYAGLAGETVPTWEYPVANIDRLAARNKVLAMGETASSTEIDNAMHNAFYPEFQEPLKYMNDLYLSTESAAGAMTSQDFPIINNVTLSGQVLFEQQTQWPLVDLPGVENTTQLIFRRFLTTGFEIDGVVGELGTPENRKMAFTKQEFYTRKSGGAIQWSDEMEMQNYIISPLQLANQQFTIAAQKIKNQKVAAGLAALTTITGASVTAYTTDHSTNNPLTYIAQARKAINYTNFGNMDAGACNSLTYFNIISNTNIKGMGGTSGLLPMPSANQGSASPGAVQIPGLPNVPIIIDESLTDGNLYFVDRVKCLRRVQGPIRTEQYRMASSMGNGLVYFDFNDVQKLDINKGRNITSL